MLVDPARLAALFFVALAVMAAPGPSVLFVVSRGVALGRAAALATVAGNEVGLLAQVVAVALGLGPVVERSVAVYTAVKLFGAAYLIYLGVQAFRHRNDLTAALDRATPALPARRMFRQGVIVGASNPKSFLLFAAILPQFTEPASGRVPLQMLVLGLVCVLIALACDSVWALLAGTARPGSAAHPAACERSAVEQPVPSWWGSAYRWH